LSVTDDARPDRRPAHQTARWQIALRWVAAAGFVAAGLNHFRNPAFYVQITPPVFPARDVLVAVSGVCEIAGGLGLLVRPLRQVAGWGLIALLVAVFPANIYMAVSPEASAGVDLPPWALWVRLPSQLVFVAWVWAASRRARRPRRAG
jgi:uncharacterized membrane protein